MSGGVDSSVAAALLKEQGYQVLGVTFRLLACTSDTLPEGSCCSRRDVQDAINVASALGIKHVVADFSQLFEQHVVEPFVQSYARGATPNPCILCNQHIKFRALIDFADAHGIAHVATGHYARITRQDDRWSLKEGVDGEKDQTYFLFPMEQPVLERLLFPLGEMNKSQVREQAHKYGLPVAAKMESQEICFTAGGSYVDFLEERGGVESGPGDITLTDGRVVGRHRGLYAYTIGQRKGLGVPFAHPLYVVRKEMADNRLVVGERSDLACHGLDAEAPVWTRGFPPRAGDRLDVKIRYRTRAVPATVTDLSDTGFSLQFDSPVYGVATGQAAVCYDKDDVVGGGWIVETR